MIRLSAGPTKLVFVPGSNDMSHYYGSSWEVQGAHDYYVTDEMYIKLLQFTDSTLMNPKKEDLNLGGDPMTQIERLTKSAAADAIRRAIELNPNHSQLWQYNALAHDMKTTIRTVAALGHPLYVPTQADIAKRPFLLAICTVLNKLRAHKVQKEYDEWNRNLEQFYRERDNDKARASNP